MREAFRRELDQCADRLAGMCDLAGEAMRGATIALLDNNLPLAERVIQDDRLLDVARAECEALAHSLLALQSPVARDLRVLIAAVHAADTLERMGDLAVHVAKTMRRRHPVPVLPPALHPTVANMAQTVITVATTAARVIRSGDVGLARSVEHSDDIVDEQHSAVFTLLMSEDWPYGTATAVDVSQLSRFYERFADHAVSLARRTIYVVTGDPRPPRLGRAA